MRRIIVLIGVLLIAPLRIAPAAEQAGNQGTSVEALVRGIYIHGLPYEVAGKYTSNDSEVLIPMLRNPENALYWPNITKVIGIIGDDSAVEPLIEFLHGLDSETEWSSTIYRGRTSAILALGYLANKRGNAGAMDYLVKSVNPDEWADRDIAWVTAHENAERLMMQLSVSAVSALALTGQPEAGATLDELLESAHERLQQAAQSVRPDWKEISTNGLSAYYQTGKKRTRTR